jgi:hypothetical protein
MKQLRVIFFINYKSGTIFVLVCHILLCTIHNLPPNWTSYCYKCGNYCSPYEPLVLLLSHCKLFFYHCCVTMFSSLYAVHFGRSTLKIKFTKQKREIICLFLSAVSIHINQYSVCITGIECVHKMNANCAIGS